MKNFLLVTSVIFLLGCEKEIDFTGKELSPKMVVNSLIDARLDTNEIEISESVFAFSDGQPRIVENPELHLSINGEECHQLWLDTVIGVHTYYQFAAHLNAGDRIDFSAHTPKHGTVRGYDYVPNITEITDFEAAWFIKKDYEHLRLYVTIKDNPQEQNFYRIVVRTNGETMHPSIQEPHDFWSPSEVFIDDEMLFNKPGEAEEEGKSPNYFRIFSDDIFQGQEYTLNVYIKEENLEDDPFSDYLRQRVKVEIHTLSEKMYRNLRSQELASGSLGDLFSEPVKIYTNMQGGYGIFGIYNSTEKVKLVAEKGE
ncbi:hypothetical protein AGMMS49965_18330 [Bacteroidia bacterium]|nr:hypothetical protein AGMMS49965_18330 [Bacteroidia bacterium]